MIRRALFLLALAACGGRASMPALDVPELDAGDVADAAPARSIGRAHDAHVFDELAGDAGDELAADAPSDVDTTCAESVFTHLLCYGTPSGPGRSASSACVDAGAGCSLLVDEAGANPPVWCCP